MSTLPDRSTLRPAQPFRVFISYSREDDEHLSLFLQHLSNLVQQGWIDPWTDRMFTAGDKWEEDLTRRLLASDLILMLVSPAFVASDFIQRVELKTALERHAANEVKLVPIVVRPTHLAGSSLDAFQGLPKDRKPITEWPNRDTAWLSVVTGLEELLLKPLAGQRPARQPSPEQENVHRSPPTYEIEAHRQADQALSTARATLETLEKENAPEQTLQPLHAEIASLKRILRDGPNLRRGMYLDDRYQLLKILGSGGYSTAWRATDIRSGRLVAVKVLRPDILNHEPSRQRLHTGLKAMLTLAHPHILQIKEPWQSERNYPGGRAPLHYLVLELAEKDFQHYIEQDKPGPADVLRIILEIAQALEHAHTRPVPCIHRDVKPANILIMADGTAKLTDFDLARLGDSTHGSKTGALGSFFYAAPEMLRQGTADKATPAMDIYALGVTLLTGLSGKRPDQHPARVEPGLAIPLELRRVLTRALQESPEKRYPTMRAFREALEGAWMDMKSKPVPSPRRWSIWGVALTVLLGGIGWGMKAGGGWGTESTSNPTQTSAAIPMPMPLPPAPTPVDAPPVATPPTAAHPPTPPFAAYSGRPTPRGWKQVTKWGLSNPVLFETMLLSSQLKGDVIQAWLTGKDDRGVFRVDVQKSFRQCWSPVVTPDGDNPDKMVEFWCQLKSAQTYGLAGFARCEALWGKDGCEAEVTPTPEPTSAPPATPVMPKPILTWIKVEGTGEADFILGAEVGTSSHSGHPVRLSGFEISKREITVAEYRACVEAGALGCSVPGSGPNCNWKREDRDNHPINCVTWEQAKAFATWIDAFLPTEAQWEYASRGTEGREYPWGSQEPTCERAVMSGCPGETQQGCACPAGNTPLRLCDMAGNVWEWTLDCYDSKYTGIPRNGGARTKCSSSERVTRGGGWGNEPDYMRGTTRSSRNPESPSAYVGFRVVR